MSAPWTPRQNNGNSIICWLDGETGVYTLIRLANTPTMPMPPMISSEDCPAGEVELRILEMTTGPMPQVKP